LAAEVEVAAARGWAVEAAAGRRRGPRRRGAGPAPGTSAAGSAPAAAADSHRPATCPARPSGQTGAATHCSRPRSTWRRRRPCAPRPQSDPSAGPDHDATTAHSRPHQHAASVVESVLSKYSLARGRHSTEVDYPKLTACRILWGYHPTRTTRIERDTTDSATTIHSAPAGTDGPTHQRADPRRTGPRPRR
jgi:hypothetical protein